MIDNPAQVDRLMPKLRASLPISAKIRPELSGALHEQIGGAGVPTACEVTRVDYSGDAGGIVCKLEFGHDTGDRVFFASITQLRFDGRSPLAREIVAYQKHRTKRLRRLGKGA